MDISVLNGVTSDYLNGVAKDASLVKSDDNTFDSVLSSAMSALDETNDLQNPKIHMTFLWHRQKR